LGGTFYSRPIRSRHIFGFRSDNGSSFVCIEDVQKLGYVYIGGFSHYSDSTFNYLKDSGNSMYSLLHSIHTVCLYISYDFQNKQKLFT
jgi:hypothetical protein